MTFYPYLDQGMTESQTLLDGLECEISFPNYEYNTWSET